MSTNDTDTVEEFEQDESNNKIQGKIKWRKWWNEKGKYKNFKILQRKEITIPSQNVRLAEFVGIVMGDGGITNFAVTITLDSVADKEYVPYVVSLMEDLFEVSPKVYLRKDSRCVDIVIARRNLVDFCKSIGLKVGNKIRQKMDIPDWIKEKEEFSTACIRGLWDTDGCFYRHSYIVNRKKYSYLKIAFTSKSDVLLNSVKEILIKFGIYVRMTKDGNDIRIEGQKDVKKYIEMVGTHNPKFKSKLLPGTVVEWSNIPLC